MIYIKSDVKRKGGGMMQRNLDKDDIRDASDLLTPYRWVGENRFL